MYNLVTEQSLVTRSSEFEAAVQNGERSSLKALCDRKSQESEYATYTKKKYFSSFCFIFLSILVMN